MSLTNLILMTKSLHYSSRSDVDTVIEELKSDPESALSYVAETLVDGDHDELLLCRQRIKNLRFCLQRIAAAFIPDSDT